MAFCDNAPTATLPASSNALCETSLDNVSQFMGAWLLSEASLGSTAAHLTPLRGEGVATHVFRGDALGLLTNVTDGAVTMAPHLGMPA